MSSSSTPIQKDYRIEFLDPDELVGFIDEEQSREEVDSIEELEEDISLPYTEQILEETQDYVVKKKEDTRGKLAIIYTICTFIIFLLSFLVGVIDGIIRNVSIIENLTSLLPLISGFFLGTLGFVLGYYFKNKDE